MTEYGVVNNGVLFAWLVDFSDHEERKVGVCWKKTLVSSEILFSPIIAIDSDDLSFEKL